MTDRKHNYFGYKTYLPLAVLCLFAAFFTILSSNKAAATNPGIISFQGKVVNADGTNVTNGSYNFDFVMYSDITLGTPSDGIYDKWHELTKSVTVTNGVFQTNLGSATALPDFNANPSLYLAVRFNADAAGYMTPRVQMASVPYALNADKVGGVAITALGQLSLNQTWTGTQTLQPTTNITTAIVKQTSAGSPTADIFNIQTANSTSILQITGPVANEAAVTLNSVGATRALTLDSGSGTIVLGSNTTTLQKSGTAFTFDVNSGSNSTLSVTNAGAGVASLDVEGDVNIGSGRVFKVNGSQISSANLSNDGNLAKLSVSQTFTGNITLQNTADSTSNFKILTAGGSPRTVLEVGTSNTQISADANLIVNSSVARPGLPTITFSSNSSGSISGAANTTYYYRISAIVGTETAASTESWISSNSFTPLSTPSAPSIASGSSGGISGTYLYKYTYVTANGETTVSNASNSLSVSNKKIDVTIATGPTGTTGRNIYRTTNGGSTYKLVTAIADNTTTLYTDSTADGSLGVAAPSANTATTNLNSISIAFSAFPGATNYRIYRGTATLGENAYQTTASSPLIDTGSAGTAGTPIEPTAGRVGIGVTVPNYSLDVAGNISASNAYVQGSNVGQTSSCGAGTTYSGIAISGGIVTSVGACASIGVGGTSATLQTAYDSSSVPQIILTSSGGTLTVRDSAAGLGTDLFDIQNNAGTSTYLGVSTTGITTSGSISSGSTSLAGSIVLSDGSSNTVTLTASGIGTDYSLTLPTAAGSTSQCLQTDSVTASQLIFASCSAGGGVATLSAIGATPNANGATITGTVLNLQPADGSFGGVVTTTTQTFAGAKTFSALITGQAGLTVTGNIIVNNTATNTSDNALTINPGYTGGATNSLIYNGINLAAFSPTNAAGIDTINGINIGNLNDPGSTITSNGLNIGAGWDTGIKVTDVSSIGYGIDITLSSNSGTGLHITEAAAGVSAAFNNLIELQTGTLTAPAASTSIYGINLSSAGAISTSSSGIANWYGLSMTTPNITQGGGAITSNGLKVVLGTITTGGTQIGLNITPSNSNAAGTLTGINIGSITAGAATEKALLVGSGWDTILGGTTAGTNLIGFTNFVVNTSGAITGTSLNAGSGTIITSGTVGTASSTTFTGGAATFTGAVAFNQTGAVDVVMTQAAGSNFQLTASAAPTVDQLAITNAGQGVTTAGINGLSINYVGGAAAVEASGARIDVTPGGTTGGTWSGLRIVANGTGPVSGVTEYGIKIEGPTSPGAGIETGLYIGTGWDTGLDVQSGGLNLAGYTSGGSPSDPAVVATDNLAVYAKKVSGRMLLKIKGPSGLDSPLQPALFGNNTVMWSPTSAAIATGGFGTTWRAGTTGAGATHPNPSTTAPTITNQMHRLRQLNAVTTTNQILGILTTTSDSLQFWMGNAAGVGGFFFNSRFIVENYPASTVRIFSGLTSNANSVVTGTNIVTSDTVAGDVAGLWHDTTDSSTTFNLVTRNNALTTKTAIALSNAITAGNAYDWYMFVKPNDTTVYYRLDDIVNGVTYEGSTSTTVPRNTAFMGPTTIMSNGTANVAAGGTGIGVVRMYIESDH